MHMKKSSLLLLTNLMLGLYCSAQMNGDLFFNPAIINTINIQFSQPSYWDSLVAYKPLDKVMLASVTVNGVLLDSTGVQLKGNSSYNSYPGTKKPIKLSFDEYRATQTLDGLKTLNLNNEFKDPTMLREKVMLDFCNAHNILAPRATFVKVYLNNVYWGLYTAVEQVGKTFLKDRLGDKKGNLFKGDPQGLLTWINNSPSSYYTKYELKTNEITNDWSDLVHLIDEINNTPTQNFYDSLEMVLNTQSYINCWASNILFGNLDSYQGSGHNYYIYHDSLSNKFQWLTWDVNEGFGNFNMGMSVQQLESLPIDFIPNPQNQRPLTQKMWSNGTYKQIYTSTLCSFARDFNLTYLGPKIDSLANAIRADVYADTAKQYTNQNFENNINNNQGNIPGLKSFITNRLASLTAQLPAYGCWLGIDEVNDVDAPELYPNPATNNLNIKWKNYSIKKAEILDLSGRKLIEKHIANNSTDVISTDVSTLSQGIYYVKVQSDTNTKMLKFIKK